MSSPYRARCRVRSSLVAVAHISVSSQRGWCCRVVGLGDVQEGSSEVVVTHGQNILICLNSSKDLSLPRDQFTITMKMIFYSSYLLFHL